MDLPATSLCALLLLAAGLSLASGSSFQYSDEDFRDGGIPLISDEKRSEIVAVKRLKPNLGNRLDTRFNLGKKFVAYQWRPAYESRQRRTPYYFTNFRPQDSSRYSTLHWMRSYRY